MLQDHCCCNTTKFYYKLKWNLFYPFKRHSPPSCEPTAIQSPFACRIPGRDPTFRRNPVKDWDFPVVLVETYQRWTTPRNTHYLVVQFPGLHLKVHHPVVFDFFGADLHGAKHRLIRHDRKQCKTLWASHSQWWSLCLQETCSSLQAAASVSYWTQPEREGRKINLLKWKMSH